MNLPSRTNAVTGALVVCAVVVITLVIKMYVIDGPPEAPLPELFTVDTYLFEAWALNEDQWLTVLGDREQHDSTASSKVTIVEFFSFQCPACKAALPSIQYVAETFGEDVRFVHRHLPLEVFSYDTRAAVAVECAREQGRYQAYHDILFERQNSLASADFSSWASDAGVSDLAAFDACLVEQKPLAKIEADSALAAEFGIRGTPSFVINGTVYTGALSADMMEEIVREKMK